ncbi:ribosome small subunit-dependent GTPase A [Bacillus sp. 165]|uniref:ribosome small subunit-dependent GTPase A n=1 Tax=Bacillus sp. 165 TaxID=1529117 RepID=UPI001ADCA61B|nr:ribosome small subunit-dependent GTPase A [Bacillus sp. 165]MBO9128170.1 ribosome small subunit-dependent GTPase A [Bacillus sp. 165]
MELMKLGWEAFFEKQYVQKQYEVGRIVLEHKHLYRIITEAGELLGELSGRFRYEATVKSDYPAVGDWVWIQTIPAEKKAVIHGVFKRKSLFSRQAAGDKTEEQVVASNIDYVFLVNALNRDFNLRRMERYLLLAYESGAVPVVILTKRDLCEDIEDKVVQTKAVAFGVDVFAVDSLSGTGIAELRQFVRPGKTIALLGSSGAGKSTLLNALMGSAVSKTGGIRESDDKGKHTTTHRELFQLPSGALIIDTPGMRELQLWEGSESMDVTFSDIDELSGQCRFVDCKHETEPGCAVKHAIEEGNLQQERFTSYKKLQREIAYAMRKQDPVLARAEREKWKKINKAMSRKK